MIKSDVMTVNSKRMKQYKGFLKEWGAVEPVGVSYHFSPEFIERWHSSLTEGVGIEQNTKDLQAVMSPRMKIIDLYADNDRKESLHIDFEKDAIVDIDVPDYYRGKEIEKLAKKYGIKVRIFEDD